MPRQITLGGEPLRPGLGPWIRQRFPEADFTAVYASAELGILAKSRRSDGWYDLSQLHERWEAWRIQADQLEVRRGETWFATGDRIQTDPEGLHFRVLGRAAAVANVAGTKVPLADVESAAEEVPGVTAAQAWAEPNPVVGQVVALRYGLAPGATLDTVQPALERHLRQRLRKEAWPRRWEQGLPELGPNAKRSS